MYSRQRKKRDRQRAVTIVIGCKMVAKAEDYRKMRESIEYQLRAGSVVVLPAYLHVEAIKNQSGGRRIVIKQESEVEA